MCAVAGAHAYIIDLEHGSATVDGCVEAIRAGESFAIPILVRVPSASLDEASRLLDAGARGVLVADVRDADDCERARAATFHPPAGGRGFGGCRENSYGQEPPKTRAYLSELDAVWTGEPILGVQIESAQALANLYDILEAPGVGLVSVGTRDLSSDLGHANEFDHPQVVEAVRAVAAAAHQREVGFGIMVRAARDVGAALKLDPSWLIVPLAIVLRTGVGEFASELKSTRLDN